MISPVVLVSLKANDRDARAFTKHVLALDARSGQGGAPHYSVYRKLGDPDVVLASAIERWHKRLDEPLWGRAWAIAIDAPKDDLPGIPPLPRLVGHAELRGGRVDSELHRATLGIGIEDAYRGKGYGKALMDVTIAWARDEAKLTWIDLGVFAENTPARALYRRMGFVEVGRREDAFRLGAAGEESVEDVQMTLDLRLSRVSG